MLIQEIILTGGTILLLLALFPTLFAQEKPAPLTSLLTASVLASFSLVYLTLTFYFSSAAAGLTALCWLVLYLQARRSKDFSRVTERIS